MCFRSSWCIACTMLKSNLANSSKVVFISRLLPYTSINHLASSLSILQCNGSSNAWSTSKPRLSSILFITLYFRWSLRILAVKPRASSKIVSPRVERKDASYKYNIPFASKQRLGLKLPRSSLNLLKLSVFNQHFKSIRNDILTNFYNLIDRRDKHILYWLIFRILLYNLQSINIYSYKS